MEALEKPFACPECGESFTNEDRMAVHQRKHDMLLQLEAKNGTFVADQTPTPTRFIRNCEEVGLFQDLQYNNQINPFDETFKKAMEERPENNSLIVVNNNSTDDTLHTPHIFPHLSENISNPLYSSKPDDKISDENNKNIKVIIDKPPRLKLIRQDSIDLIDEDNAIRLNISSITTNNIQNPIDNNCNTNSKCDVKELNKLQIPIIAITDSSKDDLNMMTKASGSSFNNKIFSQKSIDLALDNFQNEANEKTVDLNNISIDDIPHLNEINHDPPIEMSIDVKKNDTISNQANTNSLLNSNGSYIDKPSILIQNNDFNTINNNVHMNTNRNINIIQTIPFQSIKMCTNQSNLLDPTKPKDDSKVYELTLKCPDGKKVYLKEVFRESVDDKIHSEDSDYESTNENCNDLVKRKLKNVLQRNLKRPTDADNESSPSKIILTSNKAPSKQQIPKLGFINDLNNYIVTDVDSQNSSKLPILIHQLQTNMNETTKKRKPIIDKLILPALPINAVVLPSTNSSKIPILKNNAYNTNLDSRALIEQQNVGTVKTDSKKVIKNSNKTETKSNTTNSSDTKTKNKDFLERNKAAVSRYRKNKKLMNESIMNKNKMLENQNKLLTIQLAAANDQIQRLKNLLENHKNCLISNGSNCIKASSIPKFAVLKRDCNNTSKP